MTTPRELASGLTQEHAYRRGPRITAIETLVPYDTMPGLMMLRVETDGDSVDGTPLTGHGESYYLPEAVSSVIHDWMARRLLGSDCRAIESHWRFLYDRCQAFGGSGAEMRALSAVDLALWDLLGQSTGEPVWRLLGGPVRDRIPVYNSCGGPFYGVAREDAPAATGWPGHGDPGKPGPLEDNYNSIHNAGDLAEELLEEGYRGMKLWAFDAVYRRAGGNFIDARGVEEGLAPFREIRERVGTEMEIMLDGHGFFSLPAALRIAEAMREVKPMWVEDVLRPDSVECMARFRRDAGVPIAVSEMLILRNQYRQVLELNAADFVMIDPTWAGGLSESRRIAELAQLHNVPVLMHDCTGPLTLFAGLNLSASIPGIVWQETVRAHIKTLYPHLIDQNVEVTDGHITVHDRPGIGSRWLPDLFRSDRTGYRRTEWNGETTETDECC